MLLADRVKDDLVSAVRASGPSDDVAAAADLVEGWDNSADAASRGGTLFELWVGRYDDLGGGYARGWTPEDPLSTPVGLDNPDLAVRAFRWAVSESKFRYGAFDVPWGDVHRVRWGTVDVPVSGCPSSLGCVRLLGFEEDDDGLLRAYTGDAWILAVELGETPRAYSVLVSGQTADPDSEHHDDQAAKFAREELKVVAFTEEQIAADLRRRYRPGE
jgi:acyl-homoserine-lactone acylase